MRTGRTQDDDDDDVELGGHVGKEKLRSIPLYVITLDMFPLMPVHAPIYEISLTM